MITRLIFNIIIVVLASLSFGAGYLWAAEKSAKLKAAPNFTTINIVTNKSITLSQYKGKVTLVNFWATWCPPCRAEIPSLNKLYEHYEGKIAVIAISVDRADDAKVMEFALANNMQFDIAHDTDIIVRAYKIDPIPVTFILDKNGRIVRKIVGSTEWDSKEAYEFFDELLAASTSAGKK